MASLQSNTNYDNYSEFAESQEDSFSTQLIQDLVISYVQYRLRIHGSDQAVNLIGAIKKNWKNDVICPIAFRYEKMHKEILMKMVTLLCDHEGLTFQRYVKVLECFPQGDDEEPIARPPYVRVVILFSLAGAVSVRLSDMKRSSEVSLIVSYTSKFFHERTNQKWIEVERSWEQFSVMIPILSLVVGVKMMHGEGDAEAEELKAVEAETLFALTEAELGGEAFPKETEGETSAKKTEVEVSNENTRPRDFFTEKKEVEANELYGWWPAFSISMLVIFGVFTSLKFMYVIR